MKPQPHLLSLKLMVAALVLFGGFIVLSGQPLQAEAWSALDVRMLPDESFAAIEYDANGQKVRHCPYRDAGGDIDPEQLIWVLGTLAQEAWLDPANGQAAKKELETHYHRLMQRLNRDGLDGKIDLNSAKLVDLVQLPNIGPVLAVKIVDYRATHTRFDDLDDIRKVDGIGQGTFNAIRHYIRIY